MVFLSDANFLKHYVTNLNFSTTVFYQVILNTADMSQYENYVMNAERWAIKEAFDEFFDKATEYTHMRNDDEFNHELKFIMDLIWEEQITMPSQIYTND